ncbi:MAG TPA: TIGR03435 family protein [Vicinamibacterales bacterium]|jgi:uncharacterized protein (TIGR03435 family)|nr:TIGR03435 family protein [Vicinamibacterales bacterium]
MTLAAVATGLFVFGLAWSAGAQDQPVPRDTVRFDVASVRPHRSADDVMFAHQFHEGGRFTATGTLRMLIRTAYRLQEFQVVGERGWIDDERFDIDGRAGNEATPDEMRVMLRTLLRERFGLALRAERRDAPIYALRVANLGARGKLRPAAERCAGACNIRFAPGVLSARGVTMTMLASELSWWVDRIVTDQTALAGRFDLDLEWAPDLSPQAPAVVSTPDPPVARRVDSNAPSIFTAVREQLGLSLEPERGEVEVFVIDRAERPTAN